MQACTGVEINYKVVVAPARASSHFNQGTVAFAGSDSPLKPDEVTAVQEGLQRRPGHRPPDGRRPDRDRLQPARRGQPGAGRPDPGEDLQQQDHQVERPGDQGAQPGRQAAEHSDPGLPPLGRLRHHGQLHQVPSAAAPADWPYAADKAWQAKGGQAAAGSSGVAAPGQADRRRDRLLRAVLRRPQQIPTVKIDTGASAPVDADLRQRLQGHRRRQDRGHRQATWRSTSTTPPRPTAPTRSSW